jgi:hypothetical protein
MNKKKILSTILILAGLLVLLLIIGTLTIAAYKTKVAIVGPTNYDKSLQDSYTLLTTVTLVDAGGVEYNEFIEFVCEVYNKPASNDLFFTGELYKQATCEHNLSDNLKAPVPIVTKLVGQPSYEDYLEILKSGNSIQLSSIEHGEWNGVTHATIFARSESSTRSQSFSFHLRYYTPPAPNERISGHSIPKEDHPFLNDKQIIKIETDLQNR